MCVVEAVSSYFAFEAVSSYFLKFVFEAVSSYFPDLKSWCLRKRCVLMVCEFEKYSCCWELCCQILVRGRVLIILLVRGCVFVILLEEVVSSYYCLEVVSSYYCLKVMSSYYCLEAVSSYYFCLRCGCIPRLSMFQECMLSVKPLS